MCPTRLASLLVSSVCCFTAMCLSLPGIPRLAAQGQHLPCQICDTQCCMQGGFIWLFYGSKNFPVDERPPIPMVPELEDPTWKPVYGEIEFECNHWSVFENAIDMAHIHYLHNDTFGNQVLISRYRCSCHQV